jgi:hypothetical protein
MGWLKEYEFRRSFKFKMKDNPLITVHEGCPELCRCKNGYEVECRDGLYLHGKASSFPVDIVFTGPDGTTILEKHKDFEGFCSKDNRNPPWRLMWVKFAIDRLSWMRKKKLFVGYIYYGRRPGVA